MKFQVPQFIDIPDKVFGPFSIKQFIYLAGGAGVSYVLFKLLPIYIAIFIIVPLVALSLSLAFYKVNNRPFIYIIQSYLSYMSKNKLYLWSKEQAKRKKAEKKEEEEEPIAPPRLSESKLTELAWSLDVLDLDQNRQADVPKKPR